jgi:hypothetical protein
LLSPTSTSGDAISAQWTVTVGPSLQRTVIAISGATEYTTVPAGYTLTLKAN